REAGRRVVHGGQHAGEIAVPGDEPGGGLVADAGDARQPVARVTAQGGEVGISGGRHAVLRPYRRVVEDLQLGDATAAVQQPDRLRVVDELEEVAVAGVHLDRAGLAGRQRAEHVVGLVAG